MMAIEMGNFVSAFCEEGMEMHRRKKYSSLHMNFYLNQFSGHQFLLLLRFLNIDALLNLQV